jgi:hypothetical protein
MQKLQEQAEEILSRQDRGPTRFIRHLGVRTLWREYCGPCECRVGWGPVRRLVRMFFAVTPRFDPLLTGRLCSRLAPPSMQCVFSEKPGAPLELARCVVLCSPTIAGVRVP